MYAQHVVALSHSEAAVVSDDFEAGGCFDGLLMSLTSWPGHMVYHDHLHPGCCPACTVLQIIASDGVWDVLDAHEAVSRVLDALSEDKTAAEAAQMLVADAVALAEGGPDGEADNTSAVVVLLQ